MGDFVTAGLRAGRGHRPGGDGRPPHRNPAIPRGRRIRAGRALAPASVARPRRARDRGGHCWSADFPTGARFETLIGGAVQACQGRDSRGSAHSGKWWTCSVGRASRRRSSLEALWSELVAARGIAPVRMRDRPIRSRGLTGVASAGERRSLAPSFRRETTCEARPRRGVRVLRCLRGRTGRRAPAPALFVAHYPRPSVMPDAQTAILAAHEFVPEAAVASWIGSGTTTTTLRRRPRGSARRRSGGASGQAPERPEIELEIVRGESEPPRQ
mgnify:CR=1 FL=1